jgi:tetratricopeptide (TPR) repeat protein
LRAPTKPPEEPETPQTADQAYRRGTDAARESKDLEARRLWDTVLKLDGKHALALTALGLSYYGTGEYDLASYYLERAVREPAARFYLALVRRARGKPADAIPDLTACLEAGYRPALVQAVLGEIALTMDQPVKAIEHLTRAKGDVKAATLLALALRLAGRMEEARKQIAGVLSGAPLDYLALAEAARLGDTGAAADLDRLLAREPDSALELAFDYFGINRVDEATAVLGKTKHAMAHYTLGHLLALRGDTARAQKEFTAGAAAPSEYVFPHRLEEIEVLRSAIAANPKDGRARYYLGNALASKYRTTEAVAEWREAVRLEPANAIAWRNLGQHVKGAEAVAAYRRSIEADPQNYRVYVELASLLKSDVNARLALFEKAPESVRRRGVVALEFAEACAEAGRWEQAAALLDAAEVTPGEGKGGPLRLYRKVHSALAEQHRKAGRAAEAETEERRLANPPRAFAAGT